MSGSKKFFFEKKNQKTFDLIWCIADAARDSTLKSFLLLFFKKEALSSSPINPAPQP
jgi:hypothetical protein